MSFMDYNEVTTAAHCVDTTNLKKYVYMDTNLKAYKVLAVKTEKVKKDYISLKVAHTFRKRLDMAKLDPKKKLTLVGFDFNKLLAHSDCSLTEIYSKLPIFLDVCDAVSGMSGSAILQDNKIVGMHLGYNT